MFSFAGIPPYNQNVLNRSAGIGGHFTRTRDGSSIGRRARDDADSGQRMDAQQGTYGTLSRPESVALRIRGHYAPAPPDGPPSESNRFA